MRPIKQKAATLPAAKSAGTASNLRRRISKWSKNPGSDVDGAPRIVIAYRELRFRVGFIRFRRIDGRGVFYVANAFTELGKRLTHSSRKFRQSFASEKQEYQEKD